VTKEEDDEEAGVTIAEVRPGTPAAEAGLSVGDRLLTLDGRWTDSVAACYEAASCVKPGTGALLVLRRKGNEVKLTVAPRAGL
jgi:S1-C subfamily serine protease